MAAKDASQQSDPRTRAIEAALSIIGESGVAAVADWTAVGAAAGLSEGEIRELFADHSEFLRAVLRQRVESQIQRFGILAAGMRRNPPTPEDATAAIEGVLRSGLERTNEVAELEIHLQAARDPALRDDTRRAFAAYEEFASAILEGLGLPSSPEAARIAITLLTGLAFHRLSTGESDVRGTSEALLVLARGLKD